MKLSGAVLALAGVVLLGQPGEPLAQTVELGVFSGGDGVIYGIHPDGRLMWYRHDGWQTGSVSWTAGGGGRQVGSGWNIYSRVFSAGNGVIYAMYPDGRLIWYRHDGWRNGTVAWTGGDGSRVVGSGWNIYSRIFSGGNGIIYGMHPDGRLIWYRHDGWQTGTVAWTGGDGSRVVGAGWNIYDRIFSAGNGVIYAMYPDGRLIWYRHDGWQTGTVAWTGGDGSRVVGTGWTIYNRIFSGGSGILYGMHPDGRLIWYRHDGWQTGTFAWTGGDGSRVVGTGWNIYLP